MLSIIKNIKRFFYHVYMQWPIYIYVLILIITGFRLIFMSVNVVSFVITFLFFILMILSAYLRKHLYIKYIFAISGFSMYLISIKLLNIDFATITTFIFYMPMIYAFLLPDPFSTLIIGGILSYLLSTYMGGYIPDQTIIGTIISMMNASISYIMIAHLIRKLKSTNSEIIAVNNELKELNSQLKKLSIIDGLTGVYNRRYFDIELARVCRKTDSTKTLSLIMVDIDLFKIYNDTYGHQEGDKCLTLVAAQLSKVIRKSEDFVARYGGEEFVVVLPDTDVEGAKIVAEKLRKGIENLQIPHVNSKVSNVVTISLGVATIISDLYLNPEKLISFADKALYEAKQQGRNTVKVYNRGVVL